MRSPLLILLMLSGAQVFSQVSVSRQVIGSTGSSNNVSFGNISHTSGEAVVSSESSSNFDLNQGFQQPVFSINISPINFDVSNAFSPDGEGNNNNWIIQGIESFGSNTITVFNRWGDEVRTFENYDNTQVVWDGSNKNGNLAPSGTYFYVIELHDQDHEMTGWVQITR